MKSVPIRNQNIKQKTLATETRELNKPLELSLIEQTEKRAAELIIANRELAYQNKEKEKRAAELIIANKELAFQNREKEKRAAELILANKELIFQNTEKEKRAAELIIANKELAFQNKEKEKRADELLTANKELAYQNAEKEKRAAELIIANKELAFQNREKEKRAAELIIANKELAYQNKEKEKRAKELSIAKEHAEESDCLKTAFLQNMSHEIRTPMNGILGFTELLKKPNLTGDKQQQYIEIIENSGARMLNIINDIIDISKIETEQIEIYLQETNVNHLIRNMHAFFHAEAEKKGLNLIYKVGLSDDQCIIETDQTKLSQIFSNLLKNAFKFTKSGTIDFGYHQKDQLFEFYVKDTGIGIAPEMQNIIFDRFRQVDMSATRDFEGAGLGLSISKAFVEKFGGKIWVESELGKGATFLFNIPYNTKIFNHVETSSEIRIGDRLNNVNILIAEDDFVCLQLLKEMLESENANLFFANNGKEALEILETAPEIQIVLMDLKMPIMNGFEATQLIKKMNPCLPVIAQSAYSFSDDKEKAKNAGCDDYINKPVNQKILFSIINKQLERVKITSVRRKKFDFY